MVRRHLAVNSSMSIVEIRLKVVSGTLQKASTNHWLLSLSKKLTLRKARWEMDFVNVFERWTVSCTRTTFPVAVCAVGFTCCFPPVRAAAAINVVLEGLLAQVPFVWPSELRGTILSWTQHVHTNVSVVCFLSSALVSFTSIVTTCFPACEG